MKNFLCFLAIILAIATSAQTLPYFSTAGLNIGPTTSDHGIVIDGSTSTISCPNPGHDAAFTNGLPTGILTFNCNTTFTGGSSSGGLLGPTGAYNNNVLFDNYEEVIFDKYVGITFNQFKGGGNNQILTVSNLGQLKAVPLSSFSGSGFWQNNGASIYYNGGNVGIGTSTPGAPLQVGTNNNTVVIGGYANLSNNYYPATTQSYIGFNLTYNANSNQWSFNGEPYNNTLGSGSAILSDEHGYLDFVCLDQANVPYPASPQVIASVTPLVVSPSGVLVRNLNMEGTGQETIACTLDPADLKKRYGNQYVFFVGGSMTAQELLIEPCSTIWCDYVFDKDYKLTPLKDLERFIMKNKHLPDVPSAKEVKVDGFKVGDMDATMLKKIEELTLYIIQQQKQIDAMSQEIIKLKGKTQ